jgi:hypothetical protein
VIEEVRGLLKSYSQLKKYRLAAENVDLKNSFAPNIRIQNY